MITSDETPTGLADQPRQVKQGKLITVGQAQFVRDGEEVYQGSVKIHPAYLTDEETRAIFPERVVDGDRPCPVRVRFAPGSPPTNCQFKMNVQDKRALTTHVRSAHPELWEVLQEQLTAAKNTQAGCRVIEQHQEVFKP